MANTKIPERQQIVVLRKKYANRKLATKNAAQKFTW